MALDTALGDLALRLERLHDALVGLRLTVVEDKPLQGAGALLDRLGETALDLEQRLGISLGWARRCRQAAEYPRDLDALRQSLAPCQEQVLYAQRELSSEVASCERIGELFALQRERGGEWASWTRSLCGAIDQCQTLSHDVDEALFECWKQMAERAGANGIPVSTTGVPVKPTAKPKRMQSHGKRS
jgi:hypothetical protein